MNEFKNDILKDLSHVHPKSRKKGCTKDEVDAVIFWLTGYHEKALQAQIEKEVNFETFFAKLRKSTLKN